MFCPHKNSYLQLVCAINPRVINKAVDRAMHMKQSDFECVCYTKQPKKHGVKIEVTSSQECVCIKTPAPLSERCIDPHCEDPPAQRPVSMQPSLYAPLVDITRAPMGFGRIGLRILNRDLHSKDQLVQLQSLHTIMDQVQISENAMFLINLHVVYRLQDLLTNRNPVIREKVCLTLTHLAGYYQGRQRICAHPEIIFRLMHIIMRDKKEVRYAAALVLKTLARDQAFCEQIVRTEDIVKNFLEAVQTETGEHTRTILFKILEYLIEWDPVVPLKNNAFQIMLNLFHDEDPWIVCGAIDCMVQICKHDAGIELADNNDLTIVLRPFLTSSDIDVTMSAAGLMAYTTLTNRSKWRVKHLCIQMTRNLVRLSNTPSKPLLQIRAIQILINLCDCPDIRIHLREHWLKEIERIMVKTHEEWDGKMDSTSMGLEIGDNYMTMCAETVGTIRSDWGDNADIVNVRSYLRRLHEKKRQLINAINWECYL